ncbi:imidazole glycerol phosphate synthase subunit HisH [Shewanella baltica]|uniref:imidazole glycerol phosphate synthase subunit HisH n=1 Tax=Shewanella baltica TaxID=62322 RepID=UPI00217F158C|nr:imidazole glycerol phosphate synthase subunit HisH [Shewanella baltica]MCS6237825.1 imidazole glycerol phosphate synthase subunit HisH [Shewanella baltica]MCS6261885.1 imidazole glycerol phosphate synthase subunit HisH [Shewanella baltica]MCS6272463.1 imidazole glycerol phosphate synthase subunit HisH [Shewanella baltica]
MISIIDCGMGNLGSVKNMLKHIGVQSEIISTSLEVEQAEKIILPGVGNWDNGVKKLNESGLLEALNKRVLIDKVPVLGICLGMQLLLESSEEGSLPGIGWILGKVKKFKFSPSQQEQNKLRIPHMGWNIVNVKKSTELTGFDGDETRFYFVHSYHAVVDNPQDVLMTCDYGYEFACAIHHENIWGVQFHPEKSHKFGMALMKSFSEL